MNKLFSIAHAGPHTVEISGIVAPQTPAAVGTSASTGTTDAVAPGRTVDTKHVISFNCSRK